MRGLFRRMHVDDTYATTYGTLSCVIGFSSYRRKRNPRASCAFSRYPTEQAWSTKATPVARRCYVVGGSNFLNSRPIRAGFVRQSSHRRDEHGDVRHHRVRRRTRALWSSRQNLPTSLISVRSECGLLHRINLDETKRPMYDNPVRPVGRADRERSRNPARPVTPIAAKRPAPLITVRSERC